MIDGYPVSSIDEIIFNIQSLNSKANLALYDVMDGDDIEDLDVAKEASDY